jgi:integrase
LPPPVEPVEIRFLTAADVHGLAEEMHPHFRVLVYTAAYAGLRWGELIGLKRARAGRRRMTIPGFLAAPRATREGTQNRGF